MYIYIKFRKSHTNLIVNNEIKLHVCKDISKFRYFFTISKYHNCTKIKIQFKKKIFILYFDFVNIYNLMYLIFT